MMYKGTNKQNNKQTINEMTMEGGGASAVATSTPSNNEVPFIGYTDRLSARPGEKIRFYVSCKFAANNNNKTNDDDDIDKNKSNGDGAVDYYTYDARLVRSICCDPNPNGPGIIEYDASEYFVPLTNLPAKYQPFSSGSYAQSNQPIPLFTYNSSSGGGVGTRSSSIKTPTSGTSPSTTTTQEEEGFNLLLDGMKCTFHFYIKIKVPCPKRQIIASWGGSIYICILPYATDVALIFDPPPTNTSNSNSNTTTTTTANTTTTNTPNNTTTNNTTIIIARTQPSSIQSHQWYKCSVNLKRDQDVVELIIEPSCATIESSRSGSRSGGGSSSVIFAAQSQTINNRIKNSTLTFQSIVNTMDHTPFCLTTNQDTILTKKTATTNTTKTKTTNDTYINVTNFESPNDVNEVMISFWFYPTSIPYDDNKCQILASWGGMQLCILPSSSDVALVIVESTSINNNNNNDSTTRQKTTTTTTNTTTIIARTKQSSIKAHRWYQCTVCIKRDVDVGVDDHPNKDIITESPFIAELTVKPFFHNNNAKGQRNSVSSSSTTANAAAGGSTSYFASSAKVHMINARIKPALNFQRIIDCINDMAYFSLATNGTFNGKIEQPELYVNNRMILSWDLSSSTSSYSSTPTTRKQQQQQDTTTMSSWRIPSSTTSGSAMRTTTTTTTTKEGFLERQNNNNIVDLILYNEPMRAVKGRLWDGTHHDWKYGREHYGAIYFHDDDIYNFHWDHDFEFTVPSNMPSGIYIMKLTMKVAPGNRPEEGENDDADQRGTRISTKQHKEEQIYKDALPVFICPPKPDGEQRPENAAADVAVVIPTFTYVIYGNHARADFKPSWVDHIQKWGDDTYPYNPAIYSDYGLSTYNYHTDKVSGICYASHKRPLFNLRPGYNTFGAATTCSGLRHFPADSHLIAWLHKKNIKYEILTDNELHDEGFHAISSYKTVLTGSHPE